jgi:hypothetical protein
MSTRIRSLLMTNSNPQVADGNHRMQCRGLLSSAAIGRHHAESMKKWSSCRETVRFGSTPHGYTLGVITSWVQCNLVLMIRRGLT